jgi:hypothetical protein
MMDSNLVQTVLATDDHVEDFVMVMSDRYDAAKLVSDPQAWFKKHDLMFPSQEQNFVFTFSWPHPDHPQTENDVPEALIHIITDNPSIFIRFTKCVRDMVSDDTSSQSSALEDPPINTVVCGRERMAFCHHHFKDSHAARERAATLVRNPFAFFRTLSKMPETHIKPQTHKSYASKHDRLGIHVQGGTFQILDTPCHFTPPEELGKMDFVYETKFVAKADFVDDLACSSCVRMSANAPYVEGTYKMSIHTILFKCWQPFSDPGGLFDDASEASSETIEIPTDKEATSNNDDNR